MMMRFLDRLRTMLLMGCMIGTVILGLNYRLILDVVVGKLTVWVLFVEGRN